MLKENLRSYGSFLMRKFLRSIRFFKPPRLLRRLARPLILFLSLLVLEGKVMK